MKKLVGTVLMVCAGVGLALADARAPTAATPAKSPSVSQTLKQLENDWADALMAGDADKAAQIVADDWMSIGCDGSKATKQSFFGRRKVAQG
jgi:hypothetical protein